MVALRGSRSAHITFLFGWIRGIDGARLKIMELPSNPRIHEAGVDRVAVYSGERFLRKGGFGVPDYDFTAGRLLVIFAFEGTDVGVEWFCPTHAGLASAAIARLRERFG